MPQTLSLIAKNFINLLYPLHCAACSSALDPANKTGICQACENKIKTNPKPYCPKCGRSAQNTDRVCDECKKSALAFDKAWSACLYDGILKTLIHLFKYQGKLALSSTLCDRMAEFIKNNKAVIEGIDNITFVPLYNDWLNEREYNQSGILASSISREFGIPIIKPLEKIIRTKRQNELSREERLKNLKGAFQVKDGSNLNNSSILLVDDVMTTGSTLSECAAALKSAGAKEVRCLTLARGI